MQGISARLHYACVDVTVLAELADHKEKHAGFTVSQFVTVEAGTVRS